MSNTEDSVEQELAGSPAHEVLHEALTLGRTSALQRSLPRRTKSRGSVEATVLRELSARDLTDEANADKCSEPRALLNIRHSHHELARHVALGTPDAQISAVKGFSPSYISNLKRDPAFAELVDYYRGEHEKQTFELMQNLVDLSAEAAQELLRRMVLQPDKFGNANLMELLKLTADRTGHGPSSTQRVETSSESMSLIIQEIRQISAEHSEGKVIDREAVEDAYSVVEAKHAAELPGEASDGAGAADSGIANQEAEILEGEKETG